MGHEQSALEWTRAAGLLDGWGEGDCEYIGTSNSDSCMDRLLITAVPILGGTHARCRLPEPPIKPIVGR